MRKVNLVMIVRELNGEGERVQLDGLNRRTFLAWLVTDVSATTMPPYALLLRIFL